jgi:hypothetical protein
MLNDLINIFVAVLLPLFPAYVIYKILNIYAPTTTSVNGTPSLLSFLNGLKLDIKGAAAGYFLLVFIIFGYIYTKPKQSGYDIFMIEGKIGLELEDNLNADGVQITLIPSSIKISPQGILQIITAIPQETVGPTRFPSLVIEYPGYDSLGIELDPSSQFQVSNVKIDQKKKMIYLNPVVLKKSTQNEPPYSPD